MFVRASVRLPASAALSVLGRGRVPAGRTALCVFIEESAGIYRRQAVTAYRERDGRLEILGGLSAGMRVVSDGNLHLLKYFKATGAGTQ